MTRTVWKPFAKRQTLNLGHSLGRATAWVAYAKSATNPHHLISGMPRDTEADAVAEARAWIEQAETKDLRNGSRVG